MDMAHGRDWKQQAHDAGVVSTGERAGGRFNLAREHRTLSWYTLQRSVADWTIPVFGWPLSFFFSLNIFSALYLIYYTRLDEVCVCCVRSFFLHSSFGPLARSFVHSTGPCTHTHTHTLIIRITSDRASSSSNSKKVAPMLIYGPESLFTGCSLHARTGRLCLLGAGAAETAETADMNDTIDVRVACSRVRCTILHSIRDGICCCCCSHHAWSDNNTKVAISDLSPFPFSILNSPRLFEISTNDKGSSLLLLLRPVTSATQIARTPGQIWVCVCVLLFFSPP